MIKRYYFKNQFYLIVFALFGVIQSSYFFFHHKEIEKEENFTVSKILDIQCRVLKRSSSVEIEIKRQKYIVKISDNACSHYSINDTINVLYDETFDKYFIAGRSEVNVKQLKLFSLFLVILIFPWRIALRKNNNKD